MIDLILTNARAHVLNPGFDLVDSLAVGGGRIVAAGRANDIVPLGGAETRTIDMNGKTVLPGFHDAHCHVLARGLMCDQVDLSSSASIGAIKAALRDRAARNPFAPAVLGYGYSQDRLEERRHPEIDDLDSLAPGVPILLRHASGHAVTVNSRLLEMARIVSSTPDPAGGTIVRNSAGRPTGVLLENAAALAYAALPEPTTPERVLALARASSELHALGITSAVDALTLSAEMSAYRLAAEERRLTVRCTLTTDIREILNGEDCAHPDDSRCDDGDFVRVGGTKIFADGAIGTRTAALREPYADNAENKGNALYEQAELSRRIWCAHAAGWQVLAHAIGDRAIDMCLEAFDAAQGRGHGRTPDTGLSTRRCSGTTTLSR